MANTKRKKADDARRQVVGVADAAYARPPYGGVAGQVVAASLGRKAGDRLAAVIAREIMNLDEGLGRDRAFLMADLAIEDVVRRLNWVRQALRAEVAKPEDHARCDNCEAVWHEDQLKEAADLYERTEPGGTVPSGECPECGALCYPVVEHATGKLAEV